MRRALAFLLADERQEPDGYFGARDGSRMYGHGITTLLLGEVLGMSGDDAQDARVRAKLTAAVGLILRSQRPAGGDAGGGGDPQYAGGWRYDPRSNDADLSITVWQVMALRSAQAAGLKVPAAAIDAAVGYLQRSFTPDREGDAGKFAYQPPDRQAGYASTAAGLLAMQVCGRYDAPQVAAAARWLTPPGRSTRGSGGFTTAPTTTPRGFTSAAARRPKRRGGASPRRCCRGSGPTAAGRPAASRATRPTPPRWRC